MDLLELNRVSADEFNRRVHAVGADQWGSQTACTEWDVRSLVNHVTAEQLWAPMLMTGATIAEVGDRFDGDVLGDDPVATWDAAIAASTAAFNASGALDRMVNVSWGQITAVDYVVQMTSDLAIHAWDLVRGIGGDDGIDPELSAGLLELVRPMADTLSDSGMFDPPVDVSDDADPQTQLLALSGRRR